MLVSVILAAALLLLGGRAEAQCIGFQCPQQVFGSAGGQPLDGLTVPTACYSERRLRSAYTVGLGIRIVRASDSAQTDIGFTGAGAPDTAAETAFCAATTCKLVTKYDQCGTRDLPQATDANRYTRQAGPSTFRASQATAATQTHAAASNITPATGLVSLAAVVNRSVGTGACHFIRENGTAGNKFVGRSGSAGLALDGGTSGFLNTTSANATWHAAAGVINNTASVLNVDGAEIGPGGNPLGNTFAAPPGIAGVAATTCNQVEEIIWDNYVLTAGERAYIVTRQRSAWGF